MAIDPPFANAAVRHRTLNDTRPVGSAPVTPGYAIDYFGLVADLDSPTGSLDPRGPTPYGEVRFLEDGHWTPWQGLDQDGAQADGRFTGSLIAVDHATAYQVRNLPEGARNWRAAAMNTTDGPVEVLPRRGPTEAHAAVNCMSRADWGADESITKWSKGTDTQVFAPVQVVTVHHTAGSNNLSQDYSATMQAILSYHVDTNGWSDIAYQYLIDSKGIVYEGRNSGHTSKSCLKANGDGMDFAHQTGTDLIVTGGHVANMNGGNLGIALMGCYEQGDATCTGDTSVPAAAVGSLTTLLTQVARRHSLDPLGTVHYVNPTTFLKRDMAAISAHRDLSATACPGGNLYVQLPAIRTEVAQRLATPPVTGTPAAPTSLTATAISTSQITLTWTDSATNESGYRVERSTDGFSTTTKIGLGADATGYSDTGLTPGTTYAYRVIAVNSTVDSAPSNTATATTMPPPPAVPTGLTATAVTSSQINLTWIASPSATGYQISRSPDGINWAATPTATVGAVTSYSDTNLTPGPTYWYRVTAINTGGSSSPSTAASATTMAAPALPTAPSNLRATAVAKNRLALAWTDNSDNETGFFIERCTGTSCGIFAQVATVGANTTTYSNTGLTVGTSYTYRIRAYNATGTSAPSNTSSAATPKR